QCDEQLPLQEHAIVMRDPHDVYAGDIETDVGPRNDEAGIPRIGPPRRFPGTPGEMTAVRVEQVNLERLVLRLAALDIRVDHELWQRDRQVERPQLAERPDDALLR